MITFHLRPPRGLRTAIAALQSQWQASVFPQFFAWWRAQLVASLPSRLRAWFNRPHDVVWLRLEGNHGWLYNAAGWQPLGAAPAVAGHGARREAQRFYQCLARAQQVYYAFKRLPGKPQQPIAVVLALARREAVHAMLHSLRAQGVQLHAIDVALPSGTAGMGLNLLPTELRAPRPGQRQRRVTLGLLAVVLLLGLATVQVWCYNRDAALQAMQLEVARLRSAASDVQGLRQQVQNGLGASRYLAERKQATPALSLVLSELTQCLPSGTWLSQLGVEPDGQLTLAGQSEHAGNIIRDLKGCPSVTGAQFQGVIQPDETTGNERFYLLARLHKEEHHDAPPPDTP